MSIHENKRTARRLVMEVFNAGKAELVDALLAPNYVDHALPPDVPADRDGLTNTIHRLQQAFPDLEYSIEDQIAEGNKVAQRVTGRGTLKGEFMGMQPTNKTATWHEIHWYRFDVNGRVAEHWDVTDSLGMMMQLQ